MASDVCIAGIGEVLMDVFEDGTTRLGGAPPSTPSSICINCSRLLVSAKE